MTGTNRVIVMLNDDKSIQWFVGMSTKRFGTEMKSDVGLLDFSKKYNQYIPQHIYTATVFMKLVK